jgi:tRNA(fMet)-specific endonuclease VapC
MLFLFDTNVLVIYVRELGAFYNVAQKFNPFDVSNQVGVSVVTVGEIKAFALKNNWGQRKKQKLNDLLSKFIIIDLNFADIINRYAEIDTFSQGRLEGRVSNFTARNMGKNDVWIAATASVLDATFLTTDSDFDHLDGEFLSVGKIELNI